MMFDVRNRNTVGCSPLSVLAACAAAAVCLLAACAPTSRPYQTLISRLDDRGPVALSPDNPYLVANLFLSKEMEGSPELTGFIKHRGTPAALEVERSTFGPLTLRLFYPESREHYLLEDADGAWIITGPFPIERDRMVAVARLTRGTDGEPPLPPLAASGLPSSPIAGLPADIDESDPVLSRLAETAAERAPVASGPFQSPPRFSAAESVENTGTADLEIALRGLAERDAAHAAETTPRGDLVHHVSYPGETLSIIARWYTKDRENAGRIARINRLPDPNLLSVGDQIVIPSYLVRNKTRLSPAALQLLTELAARERSR